MASGGSQPGRGNERRPNTARRIWESPNPVRRDPTGAWVFRLLLLLVPLATAGLMLWLVQANNAPRERTPTVVVAQQVGSVITTTTYYSPTMGLGAFDPGLGAGSTLAGWILLLVVAAAIEIALIVWYGSFYLGSSRSFPLSLPLGTVRVLIILMVLLTLLIFALLPASWGENKAVVSLFSLLATVVGFYFGSATSTENARATGSNENTNTEGQPVVQKVAIKGISPATGSQGSTVRLTISGAGFTENMAGETDIEFDPPGGITIGEVKYENGQTLTAVLEIDAGAETVPRAVIVNLGGQALPAGKFTVTGAP